MKDQVEKLILPPIDDDVLIQIGEAVGLTTLREVSHRKWEELIHDPKFGSELQFVIDRMFQQSPFSSTDDRGRQSLLDYGPYNSMVRPARCVISVCVKIPTMATLHLRPICIIGGQTEFDWVEEKYQLSNLCRQFWLSRKNRGGVHTLDLLPVGCYRTNSGSVVEKTGSSLWSIRDRIGWFPVGGEKGSSQNTIIMLTCSFASTGGKSGTPNQEYHRLNVTIFKPPK